MVTDTNKREEQSREWNRIFCALGSAERRYLIDVMLAVLRREVGMETPADKKLLVKFDRQARCTGARRQRAT